MREYGTLEPAQVILRRVRGKRESSGGDEPHWGTVYTYMKMSQRNPLYNYYVLIKTLKKLLSSQDKEKQGDGEVSYVTRQCCGNRDLCLVQESATGRSCT
jgi:hypothetical protein